MSNKIRTVNNKVITHANKVVTACCISSYLVSILAGSWNGITVGCVNIPMDGPADDMIATQTTIIGDSNPCHSYHVAAAVGGGGAYVTFVAYDATNDTYFAVFDFLIHFDSTNGWRITFYVYSGGVQKYAVYQGPDNTHPTSASGTYTRTSADGCLATRTPTSFGVA